MTANGRIWLGLEIGDRCVVAAEAAAVRGTPVVRRSAVWEFPEGAADAAACGKSLRRFLGARGFSAGRAIAGLPARWVLAKEKTVPPSDDAALAGLLRLEAERDFSLPGAAPALDYAEAAPGADGARRLVLHAVPSTKADFVRTMLRSAGLGSAAVTVSAVAAAGTPDGSGFSADLHIGRESVELALRPGGFPAAARHLGGPAPSGDAAAPEALDSWADGVGGEIRRLLLLAPRSGGAAGPETLTVRDDAGVPDEVIRRVGDVVGLPVDILRLGPRPGDPPSAVAAPCAVAAALAASAARPGGPRPEFVRSRLLAAARPRGRRPVAAFVAAGAVVALAAAVALADRAAQERELAGLRVRLSAMKAGTAAAALVVERVSGTEGWRGERVSFLECLHDVTLAFPPNGRIWATSVAVREDMRGVISGKAADAGAVVSLLDDLRRNAAFKDVKLVHMREAGGESREIAYAVSLVFVRRGGPAAGGKAR